MTSEILILASKNTDLIISHFRKEPESNQWYWLVDTKNGLGARIFTKKGCNLYKILNLTIKFEKIQRNNSRQKAIYKYLLPPPFL